MDLLAHRPDLVIARHQEEVAAARRREASERRRARARADGWSDAALTSQQLLGVVDAYEDSQHPWGIRPEDLHDRKSGRRRRRPASKNRGAVAPLDGAYPAAAGKRVPTASGENGAVDTGVHATRAPGGT